jgi:hypothetical protein
MGLDWSDPILLGDYGSAPTGPGLYAIGEPFDQTTPTTACDDYDPYFGRWPNNLRPVYVGISQSAGRGVRGRLSLHARKKGNKYVADRLRAGAKMWFITISGRAAIEYEALFMCLKTIGQFEGNVREESDRSAKRQMKQARDEMGAQSCEFYDNLDMGKHGEGM